MGDIAATGAVGQIINAILFTGKAHVIRAPFLFVTKGHD